MGGIQLPDAEAQALSSCFAMCMGVCVILPLPWGIVIGPPFRRKEDVKLSTLCRFGASVPQGLISGVCS